MIPVLICYKTLYLQKISITECVHEIKPKGSWIWKTMLKLKLKSLKFEKTRLKPSPKESIFHFQNGDLMFS